MQDFRGEVSVGAASRPKGSLPCPVISQKQPHPSLVNKAYTSIAFQCETGDLQGVTRQDGPIYGLSDAHGSRLAVFPGGIPLVRDGSIVGAIGVSTGTIEQDQEVASAGAAAYLEFTIA
jgi:uncharacterized protein GlcG (DUF336 family)